MSKGQTLNHNNSSNLYRRRVTRFCEIIAHAIHSNPNYQTESINFSDYSIAELIVARALAIVDRIDQELESIEKPSDE